MMDKRKLGEKLNLSANDKLLEVDFRNGKVLKKVATKSDGIIYGIEISEIQQASRKNLKFIANHQMILQKGNVLNLPFSDNSFDKIYTINTVYFWEDVNRGLSEIHRVLRPNGIFINTIYSKEYLDKLPMTKYFFYCLVFEKQVHTKGRNSL
ncbi:MAG: class I SAM-dependent methyltransferase [Lactobacillales bacterium]|jgi:ubiquinone/menaquinone biosynthesis C-methylase UbiE|nr:class I SAM-dependent methyltransferase [Lactobacillales bacterium]